MADRSSAIRILVALTALLPFEAVAKISLSFAAGIFILNPFAAARLYALLAVAVVGLLARANRKCIGADEETLTVMQWNVLLDLDAPGCIDAVMRAYAPAEILEWRYRCEAIASRVRACADVAFLEEVSPAMFQDLRRVLHAEFDAWHASQVDAGGPTPEELDGAVFVRRRTVEVLGGPRCRRLHALCAPGAEMDTVLLPEQDGDCKPTSYA